MRYLIYLTWILCWMCSLSYAKAPAVLTSIKPLQMIAFAVQNGVSTPQSLLPAQASVHSYSLRPSDMQALADADIFYWIGTDLENFLPKLVANRIGKSIELQNIPNLTKYYFADLSATGKQDAAHKVGMLDTHLWLSINNAKTIAWQMMNDLSAIDPNNAKKYQQNTNDFINRLDVLSAQLNSKLEPVKSKPFYVFHATFNYFVKDFNLKQEGVLSLVNGGSLGARYITALRAQLTKNPVACAFYEPPLPPKLANTLVADLPIKLAQLDALGVGIELNQYSYEQLLNNLATSFISCLN